MREDWKFQSSRNYENGEFDLISNKKVYIMVVPHIVIGDQTICIFKELPRNL